MLSFKPELAHDNVARLPIVDPQRTFMSNISTLVWILNEWQSSTLLTPKTWKWSENVMSKTGENLEKIKRWFQVWPHYTNIIPPKNIHAIYEHPSMYIKWMTGHYSTCTKNFNVGSGQKKLYPKQVKIWNKLKIIKFDPTSPIRPLKNIHAKY